MTSNKISVKAIQPEPRIELSGPIGETGIQLSLSLQEASSLRDELSAAIQKLNPDVAA